MKSITSIENLICSDMQIRARMAFHIVSVVGDVPVTENCYIKNIMFKNIMLTQRAVSKVYGREDAPVDNLLFSDIMAITDEMPDKNADIFDIKDCSNVKVSNLMKN